MVDFRRGITALCMLGLFTGLASAQVSGGTGQSQLTCNTNVTVTPNLRAEGFTEQTGDITITCTGGPQLVAGSIIPTVSIAVSYSQPITSRLLPIVANANTQAVSNASEALLLIDEPGSGLQGYGPSLPQMLCATPLTGCTSQVGAVPGVTFNTAVLPGTSTPAPNVYQGLVTGNIVTFNGVPVLPPNTTGLRVFRVTNVRVNANGAGATSSVVPITTSIIISGATSLGIQNPAPIVGYVSPGLDAGSGSSSQNQCSSQTKTSISTLTFTEKFPTAFKTRVQATSNSLYAGQVYFGGQNIPGGIYNSESNFIFPINGNQVAGLADFGTRLKATFNNIPSGTKIFVSTSNVNNNAFPVTAPSPIGGSGGNGNNTSASGYVGYAQLVTGEGTANGNGLNSGFFPAVTATDNGPNNGNVPIAEVTIVGGTGAAVWEVVNTNPNTLESLKFGVYATYSADVTNNAPLPGISTVNLSFAPTASSGVASSTLGIPRFAGDSVAARTLLTINICRTILLYPYITNQGGFDTGLAIANTSLDPFTKDANKTKAQSGSCSLNFYGGTTAAPTVPPPAQDTPLIPGGTVWVNTLGQMGAAATFQGYMFAVCNFQFAHGFAFVSDVGARNIAMGYLAIVVPDPGTGTRNSTPPCQGISGCSSTGEQGGH